MLIQTGIGERATMIGCSGEWERERGFDGDGEEGYHGFNRGRGSFTGANLERSGTMNIAWLGADRQSEYRRERNRSGPKQ